VQMEPIRRTEQPCCVSPHKATKIMQIRSPGRY
jgi:hypothetical protein